MIHDIMRGMTKNINFAKSSEREEKSLCDLFPFPPSLSASSKIFIFLASSVIVLSGGCEWVGKN